MIEYNIEISKEQSEEFHHRFKYGFKKIISITYKKNPKNDGCQNGYVIPNEFIIIKHQGWLDDINNKDTSAFREYKANNFHEEFSYLMEWIRPLIREYVIDQLIRDKDCVKN
jgi:hypothetical protein